MFAAEVFDVRGWGVNYSADGDVSLILYSWSEEEETDAYTAGAEKSTLYAKSVAGSLSCSAATDCMWRCLVIGLRGRPAR